VRVSACGGFDAVFNHGVSASRRNDGGEPSNHCSESCRIFAARENFMQEQKKMKKMHERI